MRLWMGCAVASAASAAFALVGWMFAACSGAAGSLRASAEAVVGLAEAAAVAQVEEQEKPALGDFRQRTAAEVGFAGVGSWLVVPDYPPGYGYFVETGPVA